MDARKRRGKYPYNYKPSTRYAILQHAIQDGDLKVVSKLVDIYGCDPNYSEGYTHTPLHDAAIHGHLNIVKYLVITKGVRPGVHGRSDALNSMCTSLFGTETHDPLFFDTFYYEAYETSMRRNRKATPEHLKVMKLLLDNGWRWYVDPQPVKPLPVLLRQFHIDVRRCALKLVLSQGDASDLAYINEHDYLSLATIKEQFEACRELTKCIRSPSTLSYLVDNGVLIVTVKLIRKYKFTAEVYECLVQNCSEDVYTTSLRSTSSLYDEFVPRNEYTLLDYACESNILPLMKAIAKGNIHSRDSQGRTPLHVACKHNRLKFVSFLIDEASDQNAVTYDGKLPLHIAAKHSSVGVVKLVSSCDVNRQDEYEQNTPLHLACKRLTIFTTHYNYFTMSEKSLSKHISSSEWATSIEVVKYLMCEKKCKADIYNDDNELPLHSFVAWLSSDYCDAEFSSKIVDIAVKSISDAEFGIIQLRDHEGNTLLHLACAAGSLELVRYLVLEKQSDISLKNYKQNLPLHIACNKHSIDMVKLVSGGISKECLLARNSQSKTPLHLACEREDFGKDNVTAHKNLVRYLVFEKGCKPIDYPDIFSNLRHYQFACADKNDFDLLSVLATKENVHYDAYFMFNLLIACRNNNLEGVRHLVHLKQRIGMYFVGMDDIHPLHVACTKSAKMAGLVASLSLDVDSKDGCGQTPLHLACQHDMIDVVKLLINKYNCDQFVENLSKEYPLHIACAQSLALVKQLTIDPFLLRAVTWEGYTPIHIACKYHKSEIVVYLVQKQEGDLSSLFTSHRFHPLHFACEAGSVEMVKCLIENKANTYEMFRDGNSPLHIACNSESLDVVQYLIDSGHDVKSLNFKKELPLHIACSKSLGLVKATSYKCTVNELESKTADEVLPLHIAAAFGLLDVVQFLVEVKNCNIHALDDYGNDALAYACGYKANVLYRSIEVQSGIGCDTASISFPEVAKYLVQQGCNPAKNINRFRYGEEISAIQRSIELKNFDLFKALIDHEMNVNSQDEAGNTPLLLLCKFFCKESQASETSEDFFNKSIRYVITDRECHQHIVNENGELALHIVASASKHTSIIKIVDLLQCSHSSALGCLLVAIRNNSGDTPLHIACQHHNLSLLRHMLGFCNDQEYNIQNNKGYTALHIAVINSDIDIVRFFLSEVKQVCSTIKDVNGAAPIHYARSKEILELLMKHDSNNINIPAGDGNSPLHIQTMLYLCCSQSSYYWPTYLIRNTSESGSTKMKHVKEIIKCLLSYDALVLAKNEDGNTPLHLACDMKGSCAHTSEQCQCTRIIQILFSCGAQVPSECMSVQNRDGNTPLHIACLQQKVCVVKALCESGCNFTIQNCSGDTPFHIACATGYFPVIDYIITTQYSCMAALSVRNNHGDLPFHVALGLFQSECFDSHAPSESRNLLEFFAKNFIGITTKNKDNETLLHLACKLKGPYTLGLVQFLVRSANYDATSSIQLKLHLLPQDMINWQDINGNTPLHLACSSGQFHIALCLLQEMKYIPHTRNKDGRTALHCACASSNPKGKSVTFFSFIRRILQLGENISSQDVNGDTPLHLLCKSKAKRYIRTFLSFCLGDISRQNSVGETPLHIACSIKYFDLELVKRLCRCEPTCQLTESFDTALHLLCKGIHDRGAHTKQAIECLVNNGHSIAASIPNASGKLPVHLICENQSSYFGKSLEVDCVRILRRCHQNLDQQTKNGSTVLHIACKSGHLDYKNDLLTYLIEEAQCSIMVADNNGDLPSHIACRNEKLTTEMLSLLVSAENIKCQNMSKNTALHEACSHQRGYGSERIIQLLIKIGAKLDIPNLELQYPIHLACMFQSLSVVRSLGYYGLTMKTKDGNTVFHEACKNTNHDASSVVQYLRDYRPELDLKAVNSEGDLALHVACRNTRLSSLVESMIQADTDLNSTNNYGDTPIFELVNAKQPSRMILQLLQQHEAYNVTVTNVKSESLLHLACKKNYQDIVLFLLTEKSSEMREYVNFKDNSGCTPVMLTTNSTIIQALLDSGASPEPLYKMHHEFFQAFGPDTPPVIPVSVLVIGHPCVGKTSLVSSLKEEKKGVITETLARTAGIVPNDFNSEIYGQVTMYDFAGQPEYYASHDAVIHSCIKNSPPIVLLVVNLMDSVQEIVKIINYWSTFIKNRLTSLSDKAHLYIICSHADVIQSKGRDPTSKSKALLTAVEEGKHQTATLEFKELLAMNCTDSQSVEITELRQFLAKSTKQLRRKGVLNFRSHCLSTYLKQEFQDNVAIPLEKVMYRAKLAAKKKSLGHDLIPQDTALLKNICRDLSDCGVVIFLENLKHFHRSWLVLNKDSLLADVSGQLFAPSSFPEHVNIYGSNTGVVRYSMLRSVFPQYDPNMLFGFLSHMEYCQEICDQQVAEMLLSIEKFDESEKYYFFPNVVRVERPPKEWKHLGKPGYQFGWIMECNNGHLSAYFVHLLLLRLMFGSTKIKCLSPAPFDIHTMSTVWKSGILWSNEDGIDTIVDVIDQSKVLVLMHCHDNLRDKIFCLKHRSNLLNAIRDIKQETCPAVSTTEFLFEPKYIDHPIKPDYKQVLISVNEVIKSVSNQHSYVHTDCLHRVDPNDVLFFDPYIHLCSTLVAALCNPELSQEEPSQEFLNALSNHLHSFYELFVKLIKPSPMLLADIVQQQSLPRKFVGLLEIWLNRIGKTFKSLKDQFDGLTVFRVDSKLPGKCKLVSCGVYSCELCMHCGEKGYLQTCMYADGKSLCCSHYCMSWKTLPI